ncbi:TSUP family transporter [Rhodobacteraceae bacterium 2CG4]|uniref:Probable membrane transporter protein n=1 Tax=Halovulum marinum TaxID=2662447 RepID=A0A6L5YWB8_9RHOB|nr:sulfite exporter TauE/SafE family protein [Halovulum marinum]MSU88135.1 TSUP family transporter [Halovulum marinum]
MEQLVAEYGIWTVAAAFAVFLFAGFVKGAVGFALPMVAISGVGSLMSAETALAALILPALVTNVQQSFRNGVTEAAGTLRKYWRLNLALFLLIGLFAQLVTLLSDAAYFMILGGMVTVAGSVQLAGWRPRFAARLTGLVEWLTGLVAGFFGGLAGVWGPPILLYLLARDTPKVELVRAQGISFMVGSFILTGAHLVSGVLNGRTLPFSVWLIVPAVAGMLAGQALQDRLDQDRFRRLTLFVLVLAGLNLLRRGLFG